MRADKYTIKHVFAVRNISVLALDKPFHSHAYKRAEIDGEPVNIYFDAYDAPKAVTMHEKMDNLVGKELILIY